MEYDLADQEFKRKIYLTENDAASGTNEFGFIVDYSEIITPVIGKTKPSNLFLQQRGSGFDSDSDIVLSKGRLEAGTSAYNTTSVSYTHLTLPTICSV